MTRLEAARITFGLFFILAGALHFLLPGYYERAIPAYLPAASGLVAVSGLAEIAGGLGLLLRRFRQAAGVGLVLLLVAVFPANIEILRLARAQGASGWLEAVLWLRLPLQPLMIWWAWVLSRPDHQPRAA